MKLKNPLIIKDLRRLYYKNNWKHKDDKSYLSNHYSTNVSLRTLKKWKNKLKNKNWQGPIKTIPPRPLNIFSKIDSLRLCKFRYQTGYGPLMLKHIFEFDFSESTIKRIIKKNNLSRGSKIENKRIHWVKWQRKHPDSLWQMDGSMDKNKNWFLPVIDDCSRFCIGIGHFKTLTTKIVTEFLDNLIKIHGKPREILTDNGTEFGGKSKDSKFDEWCNNKGIKHIRSRIHKPTTTGKVERFHATFKEDMKYCNSDVELFRMRYNHIRPHRSLYMKTPASVYFDIQKRINNEGNLLKSKWG